MNEEKKTFEAPTLNAVELALVNVNNTSVRGWSTNSYSFDIPNIADSE